MAAFFVFSRLGGAVGFPRVGSLMFIVFVLVGGVYLYGLYVDELRTVFGSLSKDALKIKSNVESRENKTDQQLKQQTEKE